jgi:AraC family transcriptional activator FtrA
MRVAILTYPNCAFFELGCAIELFALERPEYPQWYQTDVVSFETKAMSLIAGLSINAKTVSSLTQYDILIIPSWPVNEARIAGDIEAEVRAFHESNKRIYSFCSGAFLLAQLGILDGLNATTHWRYASIFKKRFPCVNYVDDVLYVYQSDIGTSAGSAAALDLGIEIIRQDFGFKVANEVAKRLVLSAHRSGGQAQFVQAPVGNKPSVFTSVLDWAREHLAQPISIDDLAAKANMTRRSFDRKFRNTLNMSANEWLIEQRISFTKSLLETSDLSIEQIAQQAGFVTAMSLRHHFRNSLGISPREYRRSFSAIND